MVVNQEFKALIEAHYDEFLRDLAKVIEVQSVRGPAELHAPFGKGPRQVLTVAVKLADQYGFKTSIVNDAVAVAQWGPDTSDYIGIVGHLDVVAAGEGWQSDPFKLNIREDTLYGRGVLDNKGPIMAVLFGMHLLKERGFYPRKTLRIIFGSDEESGSADIPLYLKEQPAPEFGFTPDCKFPAVYGERGIVNYEIDTPIKLAALQQISTITGDQAKDHVPDQLTIEVQNQLIEVQGKRSPSNAPELGVNAIMLLAKAIKKRAELAPELVTYFDWLLDSFDQRYFGEGLGIDFQDEDSGKLMVTPYLLQKVEGGLKLRIAIRYPVTVTEEQVTAGLKKAVLPGSELRVVRRIPGTMHDKNDPRIKQLSAVYAMVTGQDGTPVTTTGATYARAVPNIIAFGPSFPGQKGIAHKQDEWMTNHDLKLNMEIYMNAMVGLAKMEEKK